MPERLQSKQLSSHGYTGEFQVWGIRKPLALPERYWGLVIRISCSAIQASRYMAEGQGTN